MNPIEMRDPRAGTNALSGAELRFSSAVLPMEEEVSPQVDFKRVFGIISFLGASRKLG
jgi:hypothetical protein